MAATITSQFRKNNAIALITEAVIAPTANGGGFWVGIGKSDPWETSSAASGSVVDSVIPVPDSSNGRANEALANLMCLRSVTAGTGADFSPALVYPSNIWQTGRKYKVYDASNDGCYYSESSGGTITAYPCYISHNNNVYLCLGNNNTNSTAAPSATAVTALYETNTTDNYRWAFLYTIASGSPFNLFTFKPINSTISNTITDTAKGKIYYVRVDNGGSGYSAVTGVTAANAGVKLSVTSSAGTTELSDGGTTFTTLVQTGGVIQSITITTNSTLIISVASLTFTNNVTAKATVLLSPINGFAADRTSVIKALPCWYAAFYAYYNPAEYILTRTSSTSSADLPNVNDYRQISLVRNPTRSAVTTGATNEEASSAVVLTMDCLKFFVITSADTALTTLTLDSIISQTSTGAFAYFDYYDSLNKHLYFHQNLTSAVNLLAFATASSIILNNASYAYSSIGVPEYVPGTGEVLFLENRKSINRNENQSEEIKLIIQL